MTRRRRLKKNEAIRMLIKEVEAIQTKVGGSCRQVVEAVGLPWPTYQRWTARLRNQKPFVLTPGPKKEVQLSLDGLLVEVRQMKHRRRRSFGTTELYEEHKDEISRRELQGLVKTERCRRNAEKRASLKRITWPVPGLAWAMDATKIGSMLLQQVQDLASRYKFGPFLTVSLSGEQIAEHLEEIIEAYGPPLILKRDCGSNQRDDAVNAVLSKYLIIPLNSPRKYPQYNGAMERGQGELKGVLRLRDPLADQALVNYTVSAHALNHKCRPSLGGRTACVVFGEAREAMKVYTRPKRKEVIDWIKNEALDIIRRDGLSGANAQDAAWRRAVESWLHRNGIITIKVNGKVLPYFS